MDRLTCMQTFIRIVESGSISPAAQEVGQSSQLAGKQLRALEQSMGIQLISRTTRSQSLNEAGRTFYKSAKIILSEVEEAEALIAQTQTVPKEISG